MPAWKDASTFSQTDTVREPRAFELRLSSSCVLRVFRHRAYGPDCWLLICEPWFHSEFLLDARELAVAQHEALKLVSARAAADQKLMRACLEELKRGQKKT